MRMYLITLLLGAVLLASASLAQAQTPPSCMFGVAWTGTTNGDAFGGNMAAVGDINGDGREELCVLGADDAAERNRVFVYSGFDQSLLFTITAEETADFFGLASIAGGDLDGDGYSELLVGAEGYSGLAFETGRLYIFRGGPGPFPADRSAGTAEVILDGERMQDNFGSTVAVLPDIDGDSLPDFVVSAYMIFSPFPDAAGKIYVYSSQTMDTLYTLAGEERLDLFGFPVHFAGDVNADGVPDLAVGAPHSFYDSSSLLPGRVYIYSAPTGDLLYTFNGENNGDVFGVSVAGVDINDDGFSDIIIGAHHFSEPRLLLGRAYVFLSGPGPSPQSVDASSATYTYTGEDSLSNLGYCISGLDDINGDGFDDFAVGASHYRRGYDARPGKAFVYSGRDGAQLLELTDSYHYGCFGYTLVPWLDIDQDGVRDLWIGAPRPRIGSQLFGPGQVYRALIGDLDGDTVYGECDNCPERLNADQLDNDTDGHGDVCDNCPAVGNPDQGITIELNGDVNADGSLTAADIIALVNYTFKGGAAPLPCEVSGDVNCDGSVTASDVISMVNHVFKGGPEPCDICQAFGLPIIWTCP